MKRVIFSVILVALGAIYQESYALPMPADNLEYPVRIMLPIGNKIGTGSGFYFKKDGSTYLVTAKHVLFNMETSVLLTTQTISLSSFCRNNKPEQIVIKLQLGSLFSKGYVKYHPSADIAMIQLTRDNRNVTKDVQFAPGISISPAVDYSLKASSEIFVSDDVFVFGYPSAIGLPKVPQIDYERPLVIKGNIAGKNTKAGTIIIACPVFGGNSGGPVVEEEFISTNESGFRIIGIISQWIPYAADVYKNLTYEATAFSNSGYAVVTPIDGVYDLLKLFNSK